MSDHYGSAFLSSLALLQPKDFLCLTTGRAGAINTEITNSCVARFEASNDSNEG